VATSERREGKTKQVPPQIKRMKIAQAEGKERKKEVRNYLVAYRSTPHTTTGVSLSPIKCNTNHKSNKN